MGLAGWAFDYPALRSVVRHLPAMVPNTALAFILAGVALWCLQDSKGGRTRRTLGQLAAGGTLLIGWVTLCEYAFGWNPGVDLWLFGESLIKAQGSLPGRPAILTAANFLLYGIALFTLDARTHAGRKPSELFTVTGLLIAMLALIGYVCNVPSFYGWRTLAPNTGMGLYTVIAFLLLGTGLLWARPAGGLMELILSRTASGRMARKLLLAPVLIPMLVGWLAMIARKRDLYNAELAGWLISFANIFVFTLIIWRKAMLLREAEKVQQRTEDELREANLGLEQRVAERTADLSRVVNALKESDERVKLVLNTALDAVIIADDSGKITSWNREAESMFGWTEAEVCGMRLSETIVPTEFREAHERGLKHFLATGDGPVLNKRIEITALRRDGQVFPVELAITPIRVGETFIFSAFIRDITERKTAEESIRHLNQELERRVAQRTSQLEIVNKELESFSYSVSHDLRAPLRHIAGYVELVQEELEPVLIGDSRRRLDVINSAAKQMGTLIDNLLDFSRMGRVEMKRGPVDMNELVREVIGGLESETAGRNIRWSISRLPEVDGDHALLRQVWVNVISNSVKYSRHRERAEIQISCAVRDMEVEFRVRDNGAGFEMKYAHKLFGVFQRLHTASEFEGTGIGLASVQRIVIRHGGRTWAEGELDVGATFHFTLPFNEPRNHHA